MPKLSNNYFDAPEEDNYKEIENILTSSESVYRGYRANPVPYRFFPNFNFDYRNPGRPSYVSPTTAMTMKTFPLDRYEPLRRRLDTSAMTYRNEIYSPSQDAAVRRSMFSEKMDALSRIQSEYAKDVSESQRLNMQAGLDTQAKNMEAVNRAGELNANLQNLWRQRADEIAANNMDLINRNYAQFLTTDFANTEMLNRLSIMQEMMERDDFWQRLKARIALLQRPTEGPSLEIYK